MLLSIKTFKDLQQHIPLIGSCLQNPSLINIQTVFEKYALETVIDLINLDQAHSYDWDPEASLTEFKLRNAILSYLKVEDSKSFTPAHAFSYLQYNKINRQ